MIYEVRFAPAAARELRKLPKDIQTRLAPKINALARRPRPSGVEKLSGKEHLYRLRVGDYRIVYAIQDKILLVLVLRIGHRGDIYRKLR